MKPITGAVVSSRSLSLSQSALVLSKFLEMNTGADREMLAYLRRSSEAFDELVDFHRDIKTGRVGGDADVTKRKNSKEWDEQEEKEEISDGGLVQRSDLVEGEWKKKNTKEKKWRLAEGKNDMNDGLGAVVEGKPERKRKKTKDGEDGEKENPLEKKEINTEEYKGENGFGEIEVDKEKKKKKSKHVEDGGVAEGDGGREDERKEHQHKKKKRKVKY